MANNPSTAEYAIENCVIQALCEKGAGGIDIELNHRIPIQLFYGEIPDQLPDEDGTYLLTPNLFNYRGIDAFIVKFSTTQRNRGSPPRKRIAFKVIRINLNRATHLASEKVMVQLHPDLVALAPSTAEVHFEFWWITRKGRAVNSAPYPHSSRGSNYTVRDVSLEQVHPSIELALDECFAKYKE